MDEENVKSWATQPDVCRCCLSTSGGWDLTASYMTDTGIKEVFVDMLQECYGITISHLTDWGPSRLVCELCLGHLRDAYSFKKQVLHAEELFDGYCKSRTDPMLLNIKTEQDCFEDLTDEGVLTEEVVLKINKVYRKQELQCHSGTKKQKTNAKVKKKRSRTKPVTEYDSDVPIAELSKEKVLSGLSFTTDNDLGLDQIKEEAIGDINTETHNGPQHVTRPKDATKQLSERKRVILTCSIVLRDTTACPFRHHKSWFQCFFCFQEFMELNLLRNHTLQNHQDIDSELKKMKRYPRSLQIDISNLECRQCRIDLTDVKNMQRHFESVHDKVIYNECIADYKVNTSPYFCHLCDQEFHVFRTLTTHLNEHYANCICDVCGRSFLNSKRLKVHKRTHENGQFPCTECGKVLNTKTSKANHMETAHSKRIIKCQICFKPMKHYNDRIKHMSEAHNITHTFKCPICSREYNIKHYLATHIRQTHGNKNKKCVECGMAFITNHGLKKHMLKHSGERPFSCNVCSKSYARSYTLREHMRAHEGDRRFLGPE